MSGCCSKIHALFVYKYKHSSEAIPYSQLTYKNENVLRFCWVVFDATRPYSPTNTKTAIELVERHSREDINVSLALESTNITFTDKRCTTLCFLSY